MEHSQSKTTIPPADNKLRREATLSAMVLAGGQSTRMGQDKALISVQGVSLLQRTCEQAFGCTETVFVVTSRSETYRPLLPAKCKLIEEVFSETKPLSHGPLVGFAQGLTHVSTEWVLLLACDLPYLETPILQHWFTQRTQTESAIALLPLTEKGWEPLCGFYRTSCLPSLQAFINQGGRSFQTWLSQETVQAIVFSDAPQQRQKEHKMLFNCNTPEDLLMLKQDH